jgi:hypothetical protein
MSNIELVTGDPLIKVINLIKITDAGEASFNIPTSGVPVTAAIVSLNHERRLTDEVSVSSAEAGSDWSASKIVVNINKTETEAITEYGLALIEIQVNDGGELTWFHPVNIIDGHIL